MTLMRPTSCLGILSALFQTKMMELLHFLLHILLFLPLLLIQLQK